MFRPFPWKPQALRKAYKKRSEVEEKDRLEGEKWNLIRYQIRWAGFDMEENDDGPPELESEADITQSIVSSSDSSDES